MKRLYVILMLSVLVSIMVVAHIKPRTTTVCITQIDCGYDIGGTDMATVHKYGLPVTYKTTTVTRKYSDTVPLATEKVSATKYDNIGLATNFITFVLISAALVLNFRKALKSKL